MRENGKEIGRLEPYNEIIEGLYLGDRIASENKFILSNTGITHILSVGSGLYPKFPQKYTYKWVTELDAPSANLKQHFAACHKFINQAFASGGRVLVHCHAGISRSATIVISYLMREHGMNLAAATQLTRSKRWFINPNIGFRKQLKTFACELDQDRQENPLKYAEKKPIPFLPDISAAKTNGTIGSRS